MFRKAAFCLIICLSVLTVQGCSGSEIPEEFTRAYSAAYEAAYVSYHAEQTISDGEDSQTGQQQYYAWEDQSMYISSQEAADIHLTIFTMGQDQYSKSSRETQWTRQSSPTDYTPPWQKTDLETLCETADEITWQSDENGVLEVTFTTQDGTLIYAAAGGALQTLRMQSVLYTPQADGSVVAVDVTIVYQILNSDGEAVRSIIEANLPPEGFPQDP